jgi:predicted metal-binding protein
MNKIIMIVEKHFSHVKEIMTDHIILSDEVREMCRQNKCGHYGKNWTCPPAVKSLDEFRREMSAFDSFIILSKVYALKGSFDWEGMMSGVRDFRARLAVSKKEIEKEYPQLHFLMLGAGACSLCERCAYMDGEPCRRPDEAFVSVEACGMDVVRLMRDHGLKYHHGKNTVTYIGGIMVSSVP